MGDAMKCPRCGGALAAELCRDGSGWQADWCPGCGGSWWHDPPRQLEEIPAGMVRASRERHDRKVMQA